MNDAVDVNDSCVTIEWNARMGVKKIEKKVKIFLRLDHSFQ